MRTQFAGRLIFVIAAAMVFAASCGGGTLPGQNGTDLSAERSTMLAWHNQERDNAGVTELAPNSLLNTIAQRQAQYMASIGDYSHEDQYGHHVDVRATDIGYNWVTIGENVGYDTSAYNMFQAWLGSSGHYSNIVDPDYTEIGVGVAVAGGYEYWCVVFGDR